MYFYKVFVSLAFFICFSEQSLITNATKEKSIQLLDIFPENVLKELLSRNRQPGVFTIVNSEVDALLEKVNAHTLEVGLDPTQLPDIEEKFNYLLVWGKVTLTSGWLQGLSTLQRIGDVTLVTDEKYMVLEMPLTFRKLVFDYRYKAKLMGMGPSGGLDGSITNVKFVIKIKADIISLQAELEELKIFNNGKMSITFNGTPIVDWFLNVLSGVVTKVLGFTLHDKIYYFVSGGVNSIIKAWNDYFCSIIGGCL